MSTSGARALRPISRQALLLLSLLALAGSSREAAAARLAVGTVTAACGTSVQVPVTVSGASQLLAVQFRVAYDTSRLTPASPPAAAGGMTQGFAISSNAAGGAITVALASGSAAVGDSGTVVVLSFSVPAGAAAGTASLALSQAYVNDVAAEVAGGAVTVTCGQPPTAPEMLLSGGKVAVSCTWRSQWTGKSGVGTPVKQLDGYGYFWFESPEVPEAFAKVLDGGAADEYYGVYHTALSDVEYTVTFRVVRTDTRYDFYRPPGSVCGKTDTRTVRK